MILILIWLLGIWPTAYAFTRWGRLDDSDNAIVLSFFWPIVVAGVLLLGLPLLALKHAIDLGNKHRRGK